MPVVADAVEQRFAGDDDRRRRRAGVAHVEIGGRLLTGLDGVIQLLDAELECRRRRRGLAAPAAGSGRTPHRRRRRASLDDSPATLEVAPYIREGRTLVPVRFIAEALGLQVGGDGATQTVTLAVQIASADGSQLVPLTVLITVGQRTATVNGQPRQLEVAAEITGGRTFLPLRFVAEAFGLQVDWDPATRGIGLRR